jgi:DNA-binding GntR family transcriptional regulator
MLEIDYDAPEPPYRQVAAWLRARIESGELGPDKKIPSEQDILEETGIARTTARRAIQLLRSEGLIYTVGGRGSYVRGPGSGRPV